ncbi:MAG: hypothetical protein Q9222_002198 [Ikaeria aurantiellina]
MRELFGGFSNAGNMAFLSMLHDTVKSYTPAPRRSQIIDMVRTQWRPSLWSGNIACRRSNQDAFRVPIPRRRGVTENPERKRCIMRDAFFFLLQSEDGDLFKVTLDMVEDDNGQLIGGMVPVLVPPSLIRPDTPMSAACGNPVCNQQPAVKHAFSRQVYVCYDDILHKDTDIALEAELKEYKLQLETVQSGLQADPDNADLQSIKNDLEEVIALTSTAIAELKPASVPAPAVKEPSPPPVKENWSKENHPAYKAGYKKPVAPPSPVEEPLAKTTSLLAAQE